jgi:hypothetical protein
MHFTQYTSSSRILLTLKLNWVGRPVALLSSTETYFFAQMQGTQELFSMVLINSKKALAFNPWVLTINQRWPLKEKESKTRMEELIPLEVCKDNSLDQREYGWKIRICLGWRWVDLLEILLLIKLGFLLIQKLWGLIWIRIISLLLLLVMGCGSFCQMRK